MPLGAFAPLPVRLGGSDEEGWTARAHARMCADLVAAKRGAALCVFSYTKSGGTVVISDYYGMNGAGSTYAPDTVTVLGTGAVTFEWSTRLFEDPYEILRPINAKVGKFSGHGTSSVRSEVTPFANGCTVRTFNSAASAVDANGTLVLW